MAIHQLELDALAQTGEQRRPVTGKDRLHQELVLVDQSQICQRQGERHATHEQAIAWLLLELLNRLGQVASRTSSAFHSTPLSALDTTHFFARSMVSANGISHSSIQSAHVPVAGCRHADSERNYCYACKGCANGPRRGKEKPPAALLPGAFIVETMGIEPTTPCLQSKRLRSDSPW